MKILALILAGGKGTRLDILSNHRSKPAIMFAGKYRIIDFCLSNASNSNIQDIALLTQYKPFSLNEHIGNGKPWDLDRRDSAINLLQPHEKWYTGTADAVYQNLSYLKMKNPKYTLILSGDQIYKMDYSKFLKNHIDKKANLSIAVINVKPEDTKRFGILEVDENKKILDFKEKPKVTNSTLASMGIYIFNTDMLIDVLEKLKPLHDDLDFGSHVIPYLLKQEQTKAYVYPYKGYWQDVGTYDSYLNTSLDLNKKILDLDLYDPSWRIFTKSEHLPPVKLSSTAKVSNSLISNGTIIEGEVINSIISPGVLVSKGCKVIDSVILNNVILSEGVEINRSIIDKRVVIGNNTKIGFGNKDTVNEERPELLYTGITVIEKGTYIDSHVEIGTNCRIFNTADFKENKKIKDGSTIK